MIRAEGITKRFGEFTAVSDASFEVGEGEVVGFLGVNGAGKTTTLRVLIGFYPATSGRAIVAGFDIAAESLKARRHIGYMPETTPMYGEMRVSEYLNFRASIKGIERKRRGAEVDRVVERAGLKEVRGQVIRTVSRGYRQRIGLADALLGSPKVLILDEPTSGLDPLQRMQVRQILREERHGRTVLLSTHILSEAEAACDRIIIIRRGRIVPEAEVEALRAVGMISVAVKTGDLAAARALLRAVPGVAEVRGGDVGTGDRTQRSDGGAGTAVLEAIPSDRNADLREAVFRTFAERSIPLLELRRTERSLEEIFGILTLRSADEDKSG